MDGTHNLWQFDGKLTPIIEQMTAILGLVLAFISVLWKLASVAGQTTIHEMCNVVQRVPRRRPALRLCRQFLKRRQLCKSWLLISPTILFLLILVMRTATPTISSMISAYMLAGIWAAPHRQQPRISQDYKTSLVASATPWPIARSNTSRLP